MLISPLWSFTTSSFIFIFSPCPLAFKDTSIGRLMRRRLGENDARSVGDMYDLLIDVLKSKELITSLPSSILYFAFVSPKNT